MIFLQVLRTFRHFTLDLLPYFTIAFAVSTLVVECFSARILDKFLQKSDGRSILLPTLFGAFLPITPAYRIPMAAIARRSGALWTPVLTFIGASASAALSTFIITLTLGWSFALLRLVASLAFILLLSIAIDKIIEPRFAAAAMDSEVEPLFSRDFCEASAASMDKTDGVIDAISLWKSALSLGRITLPWLFLSLFLATLIYVILPREVVETVLGNRYSVVVAALMGIPFYFVGGLDVPVLIVLLGKGMNMGGAMAFTIAAPVVNAPVIMIMTRWLGYRKTLAFIVICWLIAMSIGMVFNFFT